MINYKEQIPQPTPALALDGGLVARSQAVYAVERQEKKSQLRRGKVQTPDASTTQGA